MKCKSIYKQSIFLVALLISMVGISQNKKRTKKEVFNVNKDAVLEINTSYADVEFDTWNRDKIEIEAILEIEGATQEELDEYFKNWNFSAMGNSEKVIVSAKSNNLFLGDNLFVNHENLFPENINFDLSGVIEPVVIDSLHFPMELFTMEIPDISTEIFEVIGDIKFDYEAYKKDGDKYMNEWKEQWEHKFDEEKFKEVMEKWKDAYKDNKESYKIQKKQLLEIKKKALEAQKKAMKEQQAALKKIAKAQKKLQEKYKVAHLKLNGNVNNDGVFFLSKGNKRFKVKKTIRIKMPKKTKLKLNVRHGEVTLAATSENINAKLSHSTLYANVINGEHTTIESSYAPLHVTKWNDGLLKVNYIQDVKLGTVNDINLVSNSSVVNLGLLEKQAVLSGNFDALTIQNINTDFETIDMVLENSDAAIVLPNTPYRLYYIGSASELQYPKAIISNQTNTQFNTIVRGYNVAKNTPREININAKRSDIALYENQN